MYCKPVVRSEITERSSSRVYGCAGSENTNSSSVTLLHDLPGIHHGLTLIACLRDDAEVVCDEEQGRIEVPLQSRDDPATRASTSTSSAVVGSSQMTSLQTNTSANHQIMMR